MALSLLRQLCQNAVDLSTVRRERRQPSFVIERHCDPKLREQLAHSVVAQSGNAITSTFCRPHCSRIFTFGCAVKRSSTNSTKSFLWYNFVSSHILLGIGKEKKVFMSRANPSWVIMLLLFINSKFVCKFNTMKLTNISSFSDIFRVQFCSDIRSASEGSLYWKINFHISRCAETRLR